MSSYQSGSVGEIQKFLLVVNSSQIFDKVLKIHTIFSTGSIKQLRDRFSSLQTEEAETVLAKIDSKYHSQLVSNINDGFNADRQRAKLILEEVDKSLIELNTSLEQIDQKITLEEETLAAEVFDCYEDCRDILKFLQLKTNVLKSQLEIPLSEPADFSLINKQEDRAKLALTKVTIAVESLP